MKGRNILIKGNTKMGPDVYIFNLPPPKTCIPSTWCRKNCYALKGNFRLPSAQKAAQWRYRISKLLNFVDSVVSEIKRRKVRIVRVHSSGDFYSEEYVRKWIDIARRCPNVLFRTTTKRDDLLESIRELNALPNFIIRESLDPSRSRSTMKLGSISAVSTTPNIQRLIRDNKIFKCINDCKKCKYACWKGRRNNYFDPH